MLIGIIYFSLSKIMHINHHFPVVSILRNFKCLSLTQVLLPLLFFCLFVNISYISTHYYLIPILIFFSISILVGCYYLLSPVLFLPTPWEFCAVGDGRNVRILLKEEQEIDINYVGERKCLSFYYYYKPVSIVNGY